jgi:glutamyl-tRNA reductase
MAEIVDDLTRVLSKKLLTDATFAIRASAESGELEAAEALLRAITQGERFSCEPPSSREK